MGRAWCQRQRVKQQRAVGAVLVYMVAFEFVGDVGLRRDSRRAPVQRQARAGARLLLALPYAKGEAFSPLVQAAAEVEEQAACLEGFHVGVVVELGQDRFIGVRAPNGAKHDEVPAAGLDQRCAVLPVEGAFDGAGRVVGGEGRQVLESVMGACGGHSLLLWFLLEGGDGQLGTDKRIARVCLAMDAAVRSVWGLEDGAREDTQAIPTRTQAPKGSQRPGTRDVLQQGDALHATLHCG